MQLSRAQPTTTLVPVTTHMEVPFGDGFRMLLVNILFPGSYNEPAQKVLAIKAVRAEFGIGLKEAKDIVDGLTKDLLTVARPY